MISRDLGNGRVQLVSGNWKMHHNHYAAIEYVQKLAAVMRATPLPKSRVASLHPPFTSLRSVQTAVESDAVPVVLGAQNCHQDEDGAFTGEVSAGMLEKLNVSYVIVGHSERRQYCAETDAIVRAKLDAVLRHKMTPILCVGETLPERESGAAGVKVASQLEAALSERPADVVGALVVAYEPIWAIGTGRTASVDDAEEMAALIRQEVERLAGKQAAAELTVQYGGSVTPDNAAALSACTNVDGLLVGGASLSAEKFYEIVRAGT
jgi:triosephosphate isomerase